MLPTEEARLRRWPRHDCAPSGCAPTHAICWRPRNPHRPHPTKQRPSSPRFPPCEAFEPRPPAARPTVVQGAGVRNPSAFLPLRRDRRRAGIRPMRKASFWSPNVRLATASRMLSARRTRAARVRRRRADSAPIRVLSGTANPRHSRHSIATNRHSKIMRQCASTDQKQPLAALVMR